ncbi:hypothetical protein [Paraburkholderia sp. C35]|uniref:hypothetical protein n=1 Tax=Paraburkholderia sp. C35 TaxID=2126993 RepID=UPI000D68D774|nr:hypothetical protein [Paraburkholderia sp. C35]
MLKKSIWALFFACGIAHAKDAMVSCDGSYQASVSRLGVLTIEGKSGDSETVKIGHRVDGGKFSHDDIYLVLYGMPFKASANSPQANYLTLYKLGNDKKVVVKQAYGAGIYSADFSMDGKFVAITTRLGVDVLDIEKRSIERHDPAYTPEFSLQSCDKN